MKTWVRVYDSAGRSYLCKLIGDHYEIMAKGSSQTIQDLADELNGDA